MVRNQPEVTQQNEPLGRHGEEVIFLWSQVGWSGTPERGDPKWTTELPDPHCVSHDTKSRPLTTLGVKYTGKDLRRLEKVG